ncbi:cytochrome P450 [Streptomyces sp. NBC_01213]|uniref:cytochrome P450 n=1 Tax=Streptomyces sp. NBC_01213 TaxID=2903776 RepID=UPI00352D910A|nr:cytochrome P450 [Streptomyces sp. NBC_01213]
MQSPSDFPVPPPGCPAHGSGVPLYGPEFAADPDGFYEYLRTFGPAAPVELSPGVHASLVTDYAAALHVLQNPDTFVRDARRWRALNAGEVPLDSAIVPMMLYRPNSLYSDGAAHMRHRQVVTETFARIDTHRLSRHVDRVTDYLISQFNGRGRVDLVADYAQLVPLLVFNELFGCPAELGDQLVFSISCLMDGVEADKAIALLTETLMELIALKRAQPGEDVTSWLMQHPGRLTDEELISEIMTLIGGGAEPTQNLIGNALRLLLSDEKYAGDQYGGSLLVEDAINDVLWNNPPIANWAGHYPVRDVELSGTRLNAGDPVLISFAAANSDPSLSTNRQTLSKRAHLAWGAGPHACPAKDPALLISILTIEKLLNKLPDIELSVPVESLTWRPGPLHRALTSLPARFTPVRGESSAAARFSADVRSAPANPVGEQQQQARKGTFWSGFLSWWKG